MNNMFSSYLAPHLHLNLVSPRSSGRQPSDGASVASFGTAGSRGSKSSRGSQRSSMSAKATRDYQVLLGELKQNQLQFQRARSRLASSLLRMGEYHVRRGEYDEAVLALHDSLVENRSVVCSSLSSLPSLDISVNTGDESYVSGMTGSQWSGGGGAAAQTTPRSIATQQSHSSQSTTYLSAIASGGGGGGRGSATPSSASAQEAPSSSSATDAETDEIRRRSLDDMVKTLSSLGKVNSLRGDDASAMRYYDEKTKIQALRMNVEEQLSVSNSVGCHAGVFFSEGHKNIMSEINEDVKALDELFRGISFRKDAKKEEDRILEETMEDTRHEQDDKESPFDAAEERSEMSNSTCTGSEMTGNTEATHRRRRMRVSVDTQASETREESKLNLPPLRQTRPPAHQSSTLSTMSDGASSLKEDNELADAIDAYRTVIDSYASGSGRTAASGDSYDRHEKKYADFLRKYEDLRGVVASISATASGGSSNEQSPTSQHKAARRKQWTLALDVHEAALALQREEMSRMPHFPPGTPRKRTASDFNQDAHATVASTLIAMGGLHYKLGDVERELEKYQEAMEVYSDTLGRDHPNVAGTVKNIGMVLAEQGQLDDAMDKFREARRIYTVLNDKSGSDAGPCCDVASALSCMGNVQNRRGDLEDALRLYGEALSIYKSASRRAQEMGGRSRLALQEVASTLKIMGMVHTKRGELNLAMGCFEEALDIMRRNFDEKGSGPVVTSILSRIGGLLSKMGKHDEAMSHYQEAYDLATRTYGTTDHPEVAQVLHYIGGVHQRGGNLEEAMRCYKNSAKIYQSTLGRNDPTVATTLVCIGSLHYIAKNLEGAMSYYTEALRLNRSAYGTKHPDVIPTMKSIALIHAKNENFNSSIEIFTDVLNIKVAEVGRAHPEVAGAHKRIGNVHYKRGDLPSAESQYRQALAIYQESLGPDHPTTKSARAIVEKVAKEIANNAQHDNEKDKQQQQSSSSSSTGFFKRAPKGYESL